MKNHLLSFLVVSLLITGCGSVYHFFTKIPNTIVSSEVSITGDGYVVPIRQFYVQSAERAAYDILWVLDNSGSMEDEVNYVRDNMNYFMETMATRRLIEYQMAVINTDWRDNTWGHGKFRGTTPIIRYDNADPVADAKAAVNDIHMCVNGPCSGTNGDEQGLNSAWQALKDNPSFIRDDANLIIVTVSDEQDSSCTPNTAGTGCKSPRSTVATSFFVDYFSQLKPEGTGVTAYYPLVGLNKADCDTILSVGQRYLDVLDGIGLGESGSICEEEFGNGLNRIANYIADNGLCFPMAYEPKRTSIKVFVNEEFQEMGFSFDQKANAACFDANHIPVNGDRIAIEYWRK